MLWDVMLSFRSNNSYDLETNIILTDKFNKIMLYYMNKKTMSYKNYGY